MSLLHDMAYATAIVALTAPAPVTEVYITCPRAPEIVHEAFPAKKRKRSRVNRKQKNYPWERV